MTVPVILFMWYCSLYSCVTHEATYANLEACKEAAAQVEHSVCI